MPANMWLYTLSWILLGAAIGAALGKQKGRQEAGMIWGALLGPIGWVVILAGPDMGPKCSACMGSVVEGASKCRHCGSDLESDDDVMSVDDMDFDTSRGPFSK